MMGRGRDGWKVNREKVKGERRSEGGGKGGRGEKTKGRGRGEAGEG